MSTFNEADHPRHGDGKFADKPGASTGIGLADPPVLTAERYAELTHICSRNMADFNGDVLISKDDLHNEIMVELNQVAIRQGTWDFPDPMVTTITQAMVARAVAATDLGRTNLRSGTVSRHMKKQRELQQAVAEEMQVKRRQLTARELDEVKARLGLPTSAAGTYHLDQYGRLPAMTSLDQLDEEGFVPAVVAGADEVAERREMEARLRRPDLAEMVDFMEGNPERVSRPVQWPLVAGSGGVEVVRGHLSRRRHHHIRERVGGSAEEIAEIVSNYQKGIPDERVDLVFEAAGVSTEEGRRLTMRMLGRVPGAGDDMFDVIMASADRRNFAGDRERFLRQARTNVKKG